MEKLYQKLIVPVIAGFLILLLIFLALSYYTNKKIYNNIKRREAQYLTESLLSFFSGEKDDLTKVLFMAPEEEKELLNFIENPVLLESFDVIGELDFNLNSARILGKQSSAFDTLYLVSAIRDHYSNLPMRTNYFYFYLVLDTLDPSDIFLLGVRITGKKGIFVGKALIPTLYMEMPSTIRNMIFFSTSQNGSFHFPLSPVYPHGRKVYVVFKNMMNIEDAIKGLRNFFGSMVLIYLLSIMVILFITVETFKYTMSKKLESISALLEYLSMYKIEEFDQLLKSFEIRTDKDVERVLSLLGRLKELVAVDPLTGAFTREHVLKRLDEEMNRSRRHHDVLSLLYIDFDDFKKINDRYGHLVGDKVLKTFGDIVRNRIRGHDIFGRIGGEEFIIIAPGTTISGALDLAERIQDLVNTGLEVRAGKKIIKPTISIGVTSMRPTDKRPEDLLNRADSALLRAKETGKNKVIAIY